MKRRNFIQTVSSAAGIAIGSPSPRGWVSAMANELQRSNASERILIVVQLTGGNDGLNTVVPYKNDDYRKARPKLRIESEDVVAGHDDVGFHPSMRSVVSMMDKQRFSVIQGVGYENPNRSHFESMDIWHSCQPKAARSNSGWLGKVISHNKEREAEDSIALHLGSEALPLALVDRGVQVPSLSRVDQFRIHAKRKTNPAEIDNSKSGSPKDTMSRDAIPGGANDDFMSFLSVSTQTALQASSRIEGLLSKPDADGDFPDSEFGDKLRTVSRLILAGLKTQIFYVTLDGFDTHANQASVHASLLRQWSEALRAFHARMERDGQSERVLVMTFSEFGRRVTENASLGTDHGAAAPMFVSGPQLKSLFVGDMPSLTQLVDGDLRYHTDFRSVYRTIVEDWLELRSEGLGLESFQKLSLI